jgi:hypothetical protein
VAKVLWHSKFTGGASRLSALRLLRRASLLSGRRIASDRLDVTLDVHDGSRVD